LNYTYVSCVKFMEREDREEFDHLLAGDDGHRSEKSATSGAVAAVEALRLEMEHPSPQPSDEGGLLMAAGDTMPVGGPQFHQVIDPATEMLARRMARKAADRPTD